MTVHAPFHPDAAPMRKRGDPGHHELLDDVLEDERSARTQRWIGWLCGILTLAAAFAAWRLL
ncbi:MAG: hypothetical protein U0529_07045 [Thermoanaerobaculia bacterium]